MAIFYDVKNKPEPNIMHIQIAALGVGGGCYTGEVVLSVCLYCMPRGRAIQANFSHTGTTTSLHGNLNSLEYKYDRQNRNERCLYNFFYQAILKRTIDLYLHAVPP